MRRGEVWDRGRGMEGAGWGAGNFVSLFLSILTFRLDLFYKVF